jgi:hypothetical protein
MRRSWVAILVVCAASSASAACSGGPTPPLPTNVGIATLAPPTPLPGSAIAMKRDSSPEGVDAHALFAVPEGSIGPFLARRGDVVVGAYVGTSSAGARELVSVPLTASGDGRGDAKVVASIATDATMLTVRPTGGTKPGFVAAWTSLSDRGELLSAVGVTDDGRARGAPIELARTSDDIVWLDAVPTSRGALVLWAEQMKGGEANILAAALGPDGAARGLPARIARAVKGWQAVASGDGVGLALVTTVSAKKSAITWQRFDADARPIGAAVTVAPAVHIAGDVDAVRIGDETCLAWTDDSQPDPQPALAIVDAAGHVRGPKRAIEGGAGGTLVGLASGAAGVAIAWEEPFRRGRASKRISLARVDAKSAEVDATTITPLDLQGHGAPELAGLTDGFALLSPARACNRGEACGDGPVLPTYVRLDAKMAVAQVDPFRLGVLREQASAGWSLACASNGCLALAVAPATDTGVARVLAVDLRPRATSFRSPIGAAPPPGAPSVQALDTIGASKPFADLAAAREGDGSIVALLAAVNDETAKRDDVATIEVHAFDANGASAGAGMITKRALASGGVAIATTDKPDDGAAIAWVARDGGDPQVHVARTDKTGKLRHDVQLTNAKGDASDVAIAWSGEQWVVAWVDARDGNGEVYATTLDRDGRSVGRGQRFTNAPGDASDTAILATPSGVWLAWADPRESPQDGFADIYSAQLRPHDAARIGDDARVLATAAHSRSPALAARGGDIALGWIEEAPMGADPKTSLQYGAMFAWLAPSGHVASDPQRLPVAGDGFPTAIAFDGSNGALHAVLARAEPDMIVLDGIDLTHDRDVTAYPLVTLDGPPSLDVALGVVGSALFWNDESADAETRRVRRATVRWTR